ncbi:hypothetical protein QBC32DRAFT_312568 [Pseudoneurospora amorphoporcata]|uniref:Uncharacterized protein n=1 Tax=Pseudoneurospora amorphoporcata TaxID=241081 RepID=A0AAN6NZD3_9PEZI|nr:hypothetical protein QBC32DRAFT_312568 [Pseudoneurospora amorphoporcata]
MTRWRKKETETKIDALYLVQTSDEHLATIICMVEGCRHKDYTGDLPARKAQKAASRSLWVLSLCVLMHRFPSVEQEIVELVVGASSVDAMSYGNGIWIRELEDTMSSKSHMLTTADLSPIINKLIGKAKEVGSPSPQHRPSQSQGPDPNEIFPVTKLHQELQLMISRYVWHTHPPVQN